MQTPTQTARLIEVSVRLYLDKPTYLFPPDCCIFVFCNCPGLACYLLKYAISGIPSHYFLFSHSSFVSFSIQRKWLRKIKQVHLVVQVKQVGVIFSDICLCIRDQLPNIPVQKDTFKTFNS